jgi:hypothetical protein
MKFSIGAIAAVIFLYCSPVTAQNRLPKDSNDSAESASQPVNTYRNLIGTEFEREITIPGWDYQGGGLITDPIWYSYYKREDGSYAVLAEWALPRRAGSQYGHFLVTDVLIIAPFAKSLSVAFLCYLPKDDKPGYFAVVRFDKRREWSRDVRKAWTIDQGNGTISPVPPKGLACQQEGIDF